MSGVYIPKVDSEDDQHLTKDELEGLGPRDPNNANASTGVEISCPYCGRDAVMQSKYSKTMCVDCYMTYVSRNRVLQAASDIHWKERMREKGLNLWDQLPGESTSDYTIFKAYIGLYPAEKPTLKRAAELTCFSYDKVRTTAKYNHFAERLDAWIHECDRLTMHQRRNEIIEMNSAHIKMAKKLRRKLDSALDFIQPEQLGPRDIVSLAKLAKDMEREARVDSIAQAEMQADLAKLTENKELQRNVTKERDLSEVLSVLIKSGALGDIQAIGVRTTEDPKGLKTQEIVVQKPDGGTGPLNVASLVEVADVEE